MIRTIATGIIALGILTGIACNSCKDDSCCKKNCCPCPAQGPGIDNYDQNDDYYAKPPEAAKHSLKK